MDTDREAETERTRRQSVSNIEEEMAAKSKKQVVNAKFFLVLVDASEELHQALYYACIRAKSAGLRVALLYVIAPAEFAHWAGVGALMREEASDMAVE